MSPPRSDAVLSDSPAYRSLAPSPSLRKKRRHRQAKAAGKKGAEPPREEEEGDDEIRMCPACEKLIQR